MLKLAVLATAGIHAQLPDPVIPPCETHEFPDPQELTVNLAYISELGNIFYQDFMDQGWCFKLVEERIYGGLQLSDSLLDFGDGLQRWANGWLGPSAGVIP